MGSVSEHVTFAAAVMGPSTGAASLERLRKVPEWVWRAYLVVFFSPDVAAPGIANTLQSPPAQSTSPLQSALAQLLVVVWNSLAGSMEK